MRAYVPAVVMPPLDRGPEPPSPRTILAWILGVAGTIAVVALIVTWISTGHLEPKLVTLVAALWVTWSFAGGLLGSLFEPAARFFGNQLTGNAPSEERLPTIDEEIVQMEQLLQQPLPRHRELLLGIRLAEIYRTHQHDQAKSDALLARLHAKYPDAPELTVADGH